MKYGLFSGILWGLDTVVLGIALSMSPYIGTAEAIAFAAIGSSFLHDAGCAIWLMIYMGAKRRLKDTLAALKTHSGKVVMLGALLGGPIGMTGYVIAINNIGAAYTAIISAFYPALGAFLSFVLLKEKMDKKQVMKDDAVDNETALQIRETTSALVYGIVVLPLFGAWGFTASATPSLATGVIALSALAGTASYLFYYKGISVIGAAKAMALNISYSAWAVVFGFVLQGTVPTPATVFFCVLILAGTVLAASDWNELFGRKEA